MPLGLTATQLATVVAGAVVALVGLYAVLRKPDGTRVYTAATDQAQERRRRLEAEADDLMEGADAHAERARAHRRARK